MYPKLLEELIYDIFRLFWKIYIIRFMNDKEGDNGAGEFWVKTPKVGEILKMNCIFFFKTQKWVKF